MKLTKEDESKLEKQQANKLDVAKCIEGLVQFRQEVVKNFNVLLSEIGSQTEKIEGEIQPQISKLFEEQGKMCYELNELMHSVNELTAKNKALSSRLTILTIFLILPYIVAIAIVIAFLLDK